jgi:Domain of unknown function (DUF4124)
MLKPVTSVLILVISLLSTGALQAADKQTKMYRWVDDKGVTHVSDSIPPEYAQSDRSVLNNHGVPVSTQRGAMSAAELAQQKAAAQAAEDQKKKAARAAMRDQVLLDTYLSVEEIEALRDRRLELMASQIKVTEAYLDYLRAKQQKLKMEAQDFRPYSTNPKAPPIDDKLAAELTDTDNSIVLYEKNLTDAQSKQAGLVAQFASDIQRFKELKSAQARLNN